jgi:phage protein D/phage baseplate assembly protein gpV
MSSAIEHPPSLQLRVDGLALPDRYAQCLGSLHVHQHLSRPTACEVALAGVDDELALDFFQCGRTLRVEAGSAQLLFEGRISATELGYGGDRAASIAVRAYDPLMALRNRQSPRVFVGLTVLDLARELTAGVGLSVVCDAPGPAWPRLLQTGNDFELLADVADRCGLYFTVHDGVLALQTLEGGRDTADLALHQELYEVHFEANAHDTARRVNSAGWNPWRGTEHRAQAVSARGGRSASLQMRVDDIGGEDPRWMPGLYVQADEHLEAYAQAELDRRTAQSLVMWGSARGDARLRPGVRVRIRGVAGALSGEHVLASVEHCFDPQHGYVSQLSSALLPVRGRTGGTLLALGQVTRIDDPDRLGRVQVALTAHGNIESDWLQLVGAGAGKGKGLVAQPDVGDRVLLLVDRVDPAQAVVLGSLWGEEGLPEEQGGLGAHASFCFVTPGGHSVRLDDGERTVRIRGSAGSRLEMGPERVLLHAAAPLTIQAPGQTLTIRANHIDLQRG